MDAFRVRLLQKLGVMLLVDRLVLNIVLEFLYTYTGSIQRRSKY